MSKDTFSPEQRAAVEHGSGAVCIVAGPGSGKTRTLTARIAYLLQEKHVPASDILALTFTNKAAHEMRERVRILLGEAGEGSAPLPAISTFHALARTLLNDETAFVDEPSRMAIIRDIVKAREIKGHSVRDLALDISKAKNSLEPPADQTIKSLVEAYNLELAARQLQDFDDLLQHFYQALRQGTLAARPEYQYILVDEFQDTNILQYEILELLDTTGNVFVIGDPLQSIYGFRGASAAVFDRFAKDRPNVTRITLGTNYRSVPEVVAVANALFPEAPTLKAHRRDHGKVQLVEVLSEYGEADWIIREIERQVGGSDMLQSSAHHGSDAARTFRDFAVLYRTHASAKQVQSALEKSGMPYQVAGEGSPYFDPAVQAIIQSLSYIEGRTEAPEVKGYKLTQLQALLKPLKEDAEEDAEKTGNDRGHTPDPDPSLRLTKLVERIIQTLALSYEKHDDLRRFTNSLLPYDGMPLAEYLDHVESLAEQAYYDPEAEAVTLLTIHAAKGLEFSRVFLLGVEEGTLPHTSRSGQKANIDEEKRLFYVAVTRARDELYLLHARTRRKEPQTVSSFITSLPQGKIEQFVDSELSNQQQRARLRALKRAQGSLF